MDYSHHQQDYQDLAIRAIDDFIDQLIFYKPKADKVGAIAAQNPDANVQIPDFVAQSWEALRKDGRLPASNAGIGYSPRRDGRGRAVPNIALKVPTGGDKSWLAITCLLRIFWGYLNSITGLALWITPNNAIYRQTLGNLKNREHSYRQTLHITFDGRVLILEKGSRLDVRDVTDSFCMMLLTLQAVKCKSEEAIEVFQDSGDIHGFTPPEGEQQAHLEMLGKIPNLDSCEGVFPMVKDSLANALRIIRPVVVLEGGHREVSESALKNVYDLNPCFVLELTSAS